MQSNTGEYLANLINEGAAIPVTPDTGHLTGIDVLLLLTLFQGTHPALFHHGGALSFRDFQAQVPIQTKLTYVCQGLSGKLRSTDCLGKLLIFPVGDVQRDDGTGVQCPLRAVYNPVDAVQTNVPI